MKKNEESEIGGNISEEHSLSTVQDTSLAPQSVFRGVDIEGLESIPSSMVAVPYLRLVQPTSQKVETIEGPDAPPGTFLFSDTQKLYTQVNYIILRAKHEWTEIIDKDGKAKQSQRLKILGYMSENEKLFVHSLPITSFTSFGKLIAKFKEIKLDKTYRFNVLETSEKVEKPAIGDKEARKYYIANFKVGEELSINEVEVMELRAREYGVILDRQMVDEEDRE